MVAAPMAAPTSVAGSKGGHLLVCVSLLVSIDVPRCASKQAPDVIAPGNFVEQRRNGDVMVFQASQGAMSNGTQVTAKSMRSSAFLRSLAAGLSTCGGAGVVFFTGEPSLHVMAFSLALAAGVMLTVSVVEMWLPALLGPAWLFEFGVGTAVGVMCFLALKLLIPEPDYVSDHRCDDLDLCERGGAGVAALRRHRSKQWKLALMLMAALTAHNFPEGLAVAVSSMQSDHLGVVVMVAIAVHNIPEGIAIALPVVDATGSRVRAMQLATLSGLAEPLGALVALVLVPNGTGDAFMNTLLCAVAGIMSSVAAVELLPEAYAQKSIGASVAGFAAGVLIMLLTHTIA